LKINSSESEVDSNGGEENKEFGARLTYFEKRQFGVRTRKAQCRRKLGQVLFTQVLDDSIEDMSLNSIKIIV
jgi:hypothetical protein